jgi:hypothetical protein
MIMTIIMSQEIGEAASSEIKAEDITMMNMIVIPEILIREEDLAV